jgi:hypothetical protein
MKFAQRLAFLPLACLATALAFPAYSLEFPSTSDRGAPPRSFGAGTRGNYCVDVSQQPSLTALLPNNSLATTFAADPEIDSALFFYVPETVAETAELVIVDASGEEVYQQMVMLPDAAGIVQVTLPKHNAAGEALFKADALYYWDFAIVCDPEDRFSDVLIGGGLQRAEPDPALVDQLSAVSEDPLAQAELYAAQGAWQETLVLAAKMRSQNPQPWRELLQSVGLDELVDVPIIQITQEGHRTQATTEVPCN